MWSQSLLLTSAIAMAVLLVIVPQTAAECNKCNGNYACVTETEFALCQGGVPTAQKSPCPPATPYCHAVDFCVADLPADCTVDESKCGLCQGWSEGNLFTCTSKNTYAICDEDGNIVEGSQKKCPTDKVCTTTDAYVCMPQCSLLHGPECPLDSPPA